MKVSVDAAWVRAPSKRGGQPVRAELEETPDFSVGRDREIIAVDDALNTLAEMDPRRAKVIELRFFGRLSVDETAEVLKIMPQSVLRD